MTAFELVRHIGVIPMSIERPCTVPTNSELKRWFTQKAVQINGLTPKFDEVIEFPIEQLIFFPKSTKRRTTVL